MIPRAKGSCGLLPMALAAISARAQQPDVAVRVDLVPTYHMGKGTETAFRWFDTLGRYSTVGLAVRMESGFRGFVSERIERTGNSADPDQLDEYYIEDPGIWRLGKQYIPFGRQNLERESIRAARGDTRLILPSVPLSVAICDNGAGRARGFAGRIGSTVGLSFAIGENFAAQPTALALVRQPDDAPGKGRGYHDLFGFDVARRFQIYNVQAEAIVLRRGETPLDPSTEVSDLAFTVQPNRRQAVTVGWSREWEKSENFFRAQGRFMLTRETWLEPMLRMKDGEFYDFGATVRVRF